MRTIFFLLLLLTTQGALAQKPSSPDDVATFNADVNIATSFSAQDFQFLKRDPALSTQSNYPPISDAAYDELMGVLATASFDPDRKNSYAFIKQIGDENNLDTLQSLTRSKYAKTESTIKESLSRANFKELVALFWEESDLRIQQAALSAISRLLKSENSSRVRDPAYQQSLFSELISTTTPSDLALRLLQQMADLKPQDSEPSFAFVHARFVKNHLELTQNIPGSTEATAKILADLSAFQKRFPKEAARAAIDLAFHEILHNQDAFKALEILDALPKTEKYEIPTTVLMAKIRIYIWARCQCEDRDSHLQKAASLLDPYWKKRKLDLSSVLLLAKIHYRLNDWEKAKNTLSEASKSYDDFEIWLGLGLTEWHLNHLESALTTFRQAQSKAKNLEQSDRANRLISFITSK